MLIETLMAALLASSCDVTRAALGVCGSSCTNVTTTPGSFALCQTTTTTTTGSSGKSNPAKPAPQKLCSYYANNTIEVPTLTIIKAWVDVGSRLCIGDKVAEKIVVYKPLSQQLEDVFRASIAAPRAWLVGPGDPEPYEEVVFEVDSAALSVRGSLSGKEATIRFRPVGVSWSFSDGETKSGKSVSHAFGLEGSMSARARVQYEVDYQLGGSWTISAAAWPLSSNEVFVKVVDPPRRALLVP